MIVKVKEDKNMAGIKIVYMAALVVMVLLLARLGHCEDLSKRMDPTHNSIDASKWHSFVVKDTERKTAQWTAVNDEYFRITAAQKSVMADLKEAKRHKCLLTYWGMGVTGTDAEEACK